jgi:hypothetical protein
MYTLEKDSTHGQQMGFKSISANTYDTWAQGGFIETTTSFSPFSLGAWHYGVYTYDGTTHRLYVDGVQRATCTGTCNVETGSFTQIYVGTFACLNCELYKGKLDEFRISKVARSAGWISTEYNNQNSPSTFLSVGLQQVNTDPRVSK